MKVRLEYGRIGQDRNGQDRRGGARRCRRSLISFQAGGETGAARSTTRSAAPSLCSADDLVAGEELRDFDLGRLRRVGAMRRVFADR